MKPWLKSRAGLLDGSRNQRRRSSTVNRSRRRRAEGHAASTRARRSTVASATSSPIHKENLLSAIVHPASVQDRDGAPTVVTLACASYPTIAHLFADGGYAGEKLENALRKIDGPTIEIIKRPDDAKGFVIIARRWVVERTLAWLNRCRRLAKDWEASVTSAEAWLLIASTRQLVRRIARSTNLKS